MSIKIEGKDFLDILMYVHSDMVKPLVENNMVYLWRIEDTLEKLQEERDYLECTMKGIATSMESSFKDGWWKLNPKTEGWLRYGLTAIENADKVRSMFKDSNTAGNLITSTLFCPCEMLSVRMLNSRAITRWNNIRAHMDKGKIYDKEHGEIIEVKYIALARGDSYPQVTVSEAIIDSFCAAQHKRNLREKITALLHLPDSLISHALQDRVKEEEMEKVRAVQLEQHKALTERKGWDLGMEEEAKDFQAIQEDQACRDSSEPIGSEWRKSLQAEEATQAKDAQDIQLKWLEMLQAEEETQASDVQEMQLKWLEILKAEEATQASEVREILRPTCRSASYKDQSILQPTCRSASYDVQSIQQERSNIIWQAEEACSHVLPIESACSEIFQAKEATLASDVEVVPHQLKPSENLIAEIAIDVPKIQPQRCKSLQAKEANAQKIQLSHLVKSSAFPRSQCYDSVPVLIRAKAPSYTRLPRAPIDLVLVLGVSGSVDEKNKLEQLKQGCKFVVHKLEAKDRLSIIVASSDDNGKPTICFQMTYMTDDAKRSANQLIASLQPHGSADMVTEAMKLADTALHGVCVQDNDRVGSIMILSDGKLTTGDGDGDSAPAENYYCITNTLGLGRSHDPCSLYASVTRGHGHGTYSFVADSYENVREAMAMYIGGLTSITALDAEICIRSAHPAVRISGIACGGYDCNVEEDGKSRKISLNNLYASEEKSFIVYVDIPAEESGGSIFSGTPKTKLLSVTASYSCPVTRARVGMDAPMEISVERPRWGRTQDGNISVEVASEVLRTKVFNGVNEIWSQGIDPTTAAAKDVTGKLAGLRKDIEGTSEAKAAMDVWLDLCEDLDHMQEGGSSDEEKLLYVETVGLSYMLSWLSSHRLQRAATPGSESKNRSLNFRTTRMQNMIDSVDTAPSAYIE